MHILEPNDETYKSGAGTAQISATVDREQASEVFRAAEPDNNSVFFGIKTKLCAWHRKNWIFG